MIKSTSCVFQDLEKFPQQFWSVNDKFYNTLSKTLWLHLPSLSSCFFWLKSYRGNVWRGGEEIKVLLLTHHFLSMKDRGQNIVEEKDVKEALNEIKVQKQLFHHIKNFILYLHESYPIKFLGNWIIIIYQPLYCWLIKLHDKKYFNWIT